MTSRASFPPPDSLRSCREVWAAIGSLTSYCRAGWDAKRMKSFRALPSQGGSLSLPRSTRAFLAPRPFSAVAATTAAMFRSHPPSLRSPPGIVVCVRGLPRVFRLAYRSETTFPRSPRSGPPRTTPPRRPRRRARSLVSLQLGAESCREELGLSRHAPAWSSQFCVLIGGSVSPPPSLLAEMPSLFRPGVTYAYFLPGGGARVPRRRAELTLGGVWAQRSGSVGFAAWSPNRRAERPLTPRRWRL